MSDASAGGNAHLPHELDADEAPDDVAAADPAAALSEDEQLAAKISAVSHRRRPAATDGISPDEEEAEGWITSYMDVITLLLAFFVMLLATANFQPPTPGGAVAESVVETSGTNTNFAAPTTDASVAARLEQFARSLRNSVDTTLIKSGDLAVTVVDDMVIVDIVGAIMFEGGTAALSREGTAVVDTIALQLVLAKFFVGACPTSPLRGTPTTDRPKPPRSLRTGNSHRRGLRVLSVVSLSKALAQTDCAPSAMPTSTPGPQMLTLRAANRTDV